MLIGIMVAVAPASAQEDEATCWEPPPAELNWTWSSGDLAILDAPAGDLVAKLRASFGPLEYSWDIGPVQRGENGTAHFSVTVPAQAYLHDLAVDYVTDLEVVILRVEDDRERQAWNGPELFIAWPNGASNPATIWDQETAAVSAPYGIVSATIRQATTGLSANSRVRPPIWHLVSPHTVNTEIEVAE